MSTIQFPVDSALLVQAGVDPAQAGQELRLLAAVKLYELRRITLGQAAELSELSVWDFTDALRRFGVSWSNLSDEQIEHDIRSA